MAATLSREMIEHCQMTNYKAIPSFVTSRIEYSFPLEGSFVSQKPQ